jgi:hypothetical protein
MLSPLCCGDPSFATCVPITFAKERKGREVYISVEGQLTVLKDSPAMLGVVFLEVEVEEEEVRDSNGPTSFLEASVVDVEICEGGRCVSGLINWLENIPSTTDTGMLVGESLSIRFC